MSFETILPFLHSIAEFITDPAISEVMVNGNGSVFVQGEGRMHSVEAVIEPRYLIHAIKRIARSLSEDISDAKPLLDARLPDGSRVAAAFPLIDFIPQSERLGVIEDTIELKIDHPNVFRFEARKEQRDPAGNVTMPAVTIRDLVKATLRHRPDRLIIGEVRGAEDAQQQWQEKTQWHTCVAYGPLAEYAAKLQTGAHVLIEGELVYREYERTIETAEGPVKVQWPVIEVVIESLKTLDRQAKDKGAAA